MTEEQQLIAEGLRDLHLPQPISGWPPAPGWWALLVLSLAIVACVLWLTVERKRRNQPRRLAATALSAAYVQWQTESNDSGYLQQSHTILRQLAISLAGRRSVSRLNGDQWVEWMEAQLAQQPETQLRRNKHLFPAEVRDALAHGAYRKTTTAPIELLHTTYMNWLRQSRPRANIIHSTSQHSVASQSQKHAGKPGAASISREFPHA